MGTGTGRMDLLVEDIGCCEGNREGTMEAMEGRNLMEGRNRPMCGPHVNVTSRHSSVT
jgi:hypothetical protein